MFRRGKIWRSGAASGERLDYCRAENAAASIWGLQTIARSFASFEPMRFELPSEFDAEIGAAYFAYRHKATDPKIQKRRLQMASTQAQFKSPESTREVWASLNYLLKGDEKPVAYAFTPPPGVTPSTRRPDPHTVTIRDARAIADKLSLDEQGFVLTRHETKVKNFYDQDEVREVYYPEIEKLLKEKTGAVRVLVFDHQVRCLPKAQAKVDRAREPVRSVHNDYTAKSGRRRVSDHLGDEASDLLKHRFAEINVWRPITGPVQESPLAVCDSKSIAPQDFVACDFVYPDKVGETYAFTYNPDHRWYFFPHLQREEAILLKCYDSAEDGRARFSAHSAFDDPTSPPDAPARESIEVRSLIFFAPDHDSASASAQQPAELAD